MKELLFYSIKLLVIAMLGGYFISEAIKDYKEGSYFICGTNIMFAIHSAGVMLNMIGNA